MRPNISSKPGQLATLFIGVAAACLAPCGAWAQAGGAAPVSGQTISPADTSGSSLQEIVVTATRRTVNPQKVAATIDVAPAAKLEASNITDGQGLALIVPGVEVSVTGGVSLFMRGIGTPNAGWSESSVGYYVDGVYLPNSSGVLTNFNNLDRIEVLKGPQGTLYGRNTTGGLVNVVTRAPSNTPTVDASLSYANYDNFTQNFYGSGPIAKDLNASLAVYHQKQGKGWSTNVFDGASVQKDEDTAAYAKLQWYASPTTKLTLSDLYDKSDSSKGWAFTIAPGAFGTDGTPYQGKYKIDSRFEPYANYHENMTSFRVDQDFGAVKFFSLTAYQTNGQAENLNQNGNLGQPKPGQSSQNAYVNFNDKTWSEELQLSSSAGDARFDWIVGAFYYNDDLRLQSATYTTCLGNVCSPLPGNLPPQLTTSNNTTLSYSGYADGTYHLTGRTHLTLGLRYTHETKGYSGVVTPYNGFGTPFLPLPNAAATLPVSVVTNFAATGIPSSITSDKPTYRAVLAQDFTDTVHGYASYNTGFKSGAYNAQTITAKPVLPEEVTAYEVGVKSELLDRHLRVNLSAFYDDWVNAQVRSSAGLPIGASPVSQNAAAIVIRGIDGEVDAQATQDLSFNVGFELLSAKYANYPGATCITGPVTPTATVLGGLLTRPCNLAGAQIPYAPDVSANFGANYVFRTDFGPITLSANDSYKSSYFYTGNALRQPAHNLVDASVTWKSTTRNLFVRLYVTNLTDEYTFQTGQTISTYAYVPGPPRQYGITVGFHY